MSEALRERARLVLEATKGRSASRGQRTAAVWDELYDAVNGRLRWDDSRVTELVEWLEAVARSS